MAAKAAAPGALEGQEGQASVEAALLLPILLALVALLAQPACLLYARTVMSHAAAEGARLAATAESGDEVEAFVRRRLAAVPDVSAFHVGGPEGWRVEVSGAGSGGQVCVSVEGRARPLPLTAAVAGALMGSDGEGVVLRASVEVSSYAEWVEGTYESWVGAWG